MPGRLHLTAALVSSLLAIVGCQKPHAAHRSTSRRVIDPLADFAGDGTPAFLRLDSAPDRDAFRRWFTFLAEAQYFNPASKRPPEIVDCAALVRYCYREALRAHTASWAAGSQLPLVPALLSVEKYSVPRIPLGPALFRVRPGPFAPQDLKNGAFAEFADAETLRRCNTYFVTRDIRRAEPGDLFFFQRDVAHMPFHTMIFVGRSNFSPSGVHYVVYDTGPEGSHGGVIRRLSSAQLLSFPDPQWRPTPDNPQFSGIFRWNILRDPS